jgi:nucleoside-diphosphate-sugar epimerase
MLASCPGLIERGVVNDLENALIGSSGFVGSALLRQRGFESRYCSTNIGDIAGRAFGTIVCAGAPAQKWIANREPEADRRNMERLIACIGKAQCQTFVLISTVDVFLDSRLKEEESPVTDSGLHAYGLHRRLLEQFVESHFPRRLIVRLPGLVGPGLRKNVIYDLKHNNNLQAIDSRAVYQFYPITNLWYDIEIALKAGIELLHLTAEPISVFEVASQGFGRPFVNIREGVPPFYDMRSKHVKLFGPGDYQYSKRDTIQAIRAYAQYI